MRSQFIDALTTNAPAFGLQLENSVAEKLADYFDIVMANNDLLHLVAPTPPSEFAVRHILESLSLLEHLPNGVKFADVGTGAGLPSIPCLIARNDLRAILIESKQKKADYLSKTLELLELSRRAKVLGNQFAEVDLKDASFITCRALDKFTERIPAMLKWAKNKDFLFFGGEGLGAALEKNNIKTTRCLMPLSEQRFLYLGTTRRSVKS